MTQMVNFSNLSPDDQLKFAKQSGKWFAPSLFITNYGPWGFKFEAECYRYKDDQLVESDSLNINGFTVSEAEKRNTTARLSAKQAFWKAWNQAHPNQTLIILKSMNSWGM